MRRWNHMLSAAIAIAAGVTLVTACKENPPPPVVKAPPGVAGPTSQETPAATPASAPATQTQPAESIESDFEPVPTDERGTLGLGPDGMTWVIFPSGIMTQDLKVGFAGTPSYGQTVWIAYTVTIPGSTKEIERVTRKDAFHFRVGSKKVIRGLSLGVLQMKPNGRRRVYIPAELAYGKAGDPAHHIPPDQPLIYDIDLISINGEPFATPKEADVNKTLDNILKPSPLGPNLPTTNPAK